MIIKPVIYGLDYIRNKTWNPFCTTRNGALKHGNKIMPKELKALGFKTVIYEHENYYRINYAGQW